MNNIPDILIIGAGASGAAAAWRLAGDGFSVVCLEQGNWLNPSEYPPVGDDWELRQSTDFHFNPNIRRRPEDYPIDTSDSEIDPLMFNAVGGSTIHWSAHTPRFHPSDFRVKTQDNVADDWPLSYKDLEPYYDMNDEMMGCSGIAGDPANPERKQRPMPPLPIGRDGERIAKGFEALGWHWWPSDSYVNSVDREGRLACNNCGPNGLGCAIKAKASVDITYLPKAIKLGAEVRPECRVRRISTDENGKITGAEYYNRNGKVEYQKARAVILACNGIGTPRLLLLSKSHIYPDGLANSSGLVGKNLMFHPYAMVSGLFPPDDNIRTWEGPIGNMIMSQEFYETDTQRGFTRGYTYHVVRSSGPARTAIGMLMSPVKWGAGHHEQFAKRFGRTTTFAIVSDDLPEEHNRVELHPKIKDSNDLPGVKVYYKTSKNTRRILDHAIVNAEKVLKAAGADEVIIRPLFRPGGWHLMGTARMGEDPKTSVTNPWGQTHDNDNLFIVDGSLFVSAASVNPTPTIQALALRTADYISKHRRDLIG